MPIRLPKEPTEKQYEELLAACLAGLGYFNEARVHLKKASREVLELDIVATPSGETFENRILFEAKKGGWGFGDLFKVYGWMTYLGIEEGCIVHHTEIDERHAKAFEKIKSITNVRRCHLAIGSGTKDLEELAPLCRKIDDELLRKVVVNGWYQQIAQRLSFSEFVRYCKTNKCSPLVGDARKYLDAIESSFFEKNAIQRVHKLYDAYKSCANISGAFVNEYSKKKRISEKEIWDKLNNHYDMSWLQYIMLLEHKARISIIKNAMSHALDSQKGTRTVKFSDIEIDWNEVLEKMAPATFLSGMKKLKDHPYALNIPFLLQIFIELFGGFFIEEDEDIELISTISGIPKKSVLDSLYLYNEFFPIGGGWFYNLENMVRMKMVPGFMRGAGCFFRKDFYGFRSYSDKYSSKVSWVLGQWHNAFYEILEPELKVR